MLPVLFDKADFTALGHAQLFRSYNRFPRRDFHSQRIHEEKLDTMVYECATAVRESRAEELKKLAQMQKMWALRKPILDAHILSSQEKITFLEQEIDDILMRRILKKEK